MGNQGKLYFGLFLTSENLLMTIILLSSFLLLAILVSMMRIYKKCGKASISAIIPIWSQIVLFQIAGISWWYIFIPIVNFIMMIKAYINLANKFGRKSSFAIGIIFLPMIFIPLLSFYDYVGNEDDKVEEQSIYNPFNQTNVEPVMPETPIAPTIDNSFNKEIEMEVQPLNNGVIANPNNNLTEVEEKNDAIEIINEPITPINDNFEDNNKEEMIDKDLNEFIEIPNIQEPVNVSINPTIEDIEEALKINKQPTDVAFNSSPIILEKEEIETFKTEDIKEDLQNEIELPEMAKKVCPACGVSLGENIKFCTSCGTQL